MPKPLLATGPWQHSKPMSMTVAWNLCCWNWSRGVTCSYPLRAPLQQVLTNRIGGITLVVRISLMVLRVAVLFNLITGIIFWTGNADPLQIVHIILGIIAVLVLWTLGIFQG